MRGAAAGWCVLLILSSCMGSRPAPQGLTPSEEETLQQVRPGVFALPSLRPDRHPGASRVSFNVSGEAGSWLILHYPIEAGNDISYRYDWEFSAETLRGVPLGWLLVQPEPTVFDAGPSQGSEDSPRNANESIRFSGFRATVAVFANGGPQVFTRAGDAGGTIGGGQFAGMFLAATSNGAWNLHAELTLSPAATFRNATPFFSGGVGTQFALVAREQATGSDLVVAKQLETTIATSGWTHFQAWCPPGPENYAGHFFIQFPGEGPILLPYAIAWVRPVGVGPGWPGTQPQWGNFEGYAGPFSANASVASLNATLNLALVHIPTAREDFPPGLALARYGKREILSII